jgi:hypothetical protein
MLSKSKKLHLLTLAAACALVLAGGSWRNVSAQSNNDDDEAGSRQIKVTDFTKERRSASDDSRQIKVTNVGKGNAPAPPKVSAKDKPSWNNDQPKQVAKSHVAPRRVYKRVAAAHRPTHTVVAPHTRAKPEFAEVGVTIWRLRKAKAAESGPKLQDMNGYDWWTPERIEGTTPLNIGDRVRLSIESPRTGYLYVINTTQYADNTFSQPKLIFPTTRAHGGDNRVMAGRLIDLPDMSDDVNFYTLTPDQLPDGSRQVGEILTVLVSKEPITELANNSRDPLSLQSEQVARWEKQWGGQVEFELEGGAGVAWTKEEQEASTTGGRSLTQEDPTPQTIYSVAAKPGSPLMVKVQLLYGQPGTAKK